MALDVNEFPHPLTEARDSILLAARNDDPAVVGRAFNGFRNARFIQAAMATRKNKGKVIALPFGLRRNHGTGGCQIAKIRTESLNKVQSCAKTCRQPKSRQRAEKERTRTLAWQRQHIGLKGMEQGFERIGTHDRMFWSG
ncbi:hypothetical protein [Mesorhizobium amorphae]|uniref:hypothetical protein n=1 Tax=Mesorhizobium amorphae TaxID=71433 RepID=UPI0028CBAA16|nr:hypothetical protein [Mesorhizobium amorphae]